MKSNDHFHRFACMARCIRCGQELATPALSEYVENEVRQVFSCSSCDYEFEMLIISDADSTLPQEIAEDFLPSLLVA